MSFVWPLAFLLFLPMTGLIWLSRTSRFAIVARLPGAWSRVVAPRFRAIVAAQSDIAAAASPTLSIVLGILIITALTRPGLDVREPDDFATLGGRVVVLDVGADLARHWQFLDALHQADPATATAVVAVTGDAYRITPFTTDKAHTDRYVRVLTADMMPRPGQNPHLGLARAERLLEDGGYLVRQVIFLSARQPPDQTVAVPEAKARRVVVSLDDAHDWGDWAEAQRADYDGPDAASDITADHIAATWAAARAELPDARFEITPFLIALAALLWLIKFRRRAE